jgi:RsiW-degrading membrane proteinase PrsW (M82 family)
MLAVAAFMLLCGACSAAFYVIVPFTNRSTSQLETNAALGATAGFGFLLAALLAWQGINALRGKDSTPAARFLLPAPAFVLAFLGAILLGIGALSLRSIASFTFPPFHFLASIFIPLAFIAYAARRLGKLSGLRTLVVSFSWGALGATFLAFVAELAVGGLILLIVALAISFTPGGVTTLERLRAILQTSSRGDPTRLANQLLSNPWVTTGFLVYVAVLIPPIEEAFKTLVLAFVNPQRTRLADAVLWGISAGAGFAALENLFNSIGLLDVWAIGMLMRAGATVMHVANGALMARGWYAARVERRWSRLVAAFSVSVFVHGLWNGSVILLSQRAATLGADPAAALTQSPAQGVLIIALVAVIALLSVLGLVWIVYAVQSAPTSLQVSHLNEESSE